MQKLKIRANILFAGIGCQERGFEDSGVIDLDVLSISEIDKNAVLSYAAIHKGLTEEMVAQFDSYPGIEEMVQELKDKNIGYDPKEDKEYGWDKIKKNQEQIKKNWLASYLSRNLGDISRIRSLPQADLWTVSFPCTDISSAGEMKGFKDGTGTRSSLLWQQMRLLEAALKDGTAPDYLLYENVKALVSKKFRGDFEQLLEILRGYGYEPHWEIMNARDCGIPQQRERVFVLCIRKGARGSGFTFPEPFAGGKSLDEILSPPIERYPSWDTRVSEYLHGHIKDGRLLPLDRDGSLDFEETGTGMEEKSSEPYKEQKLMPETCFALMGMKPEDASKCIQIGVSATQLCKQAGNGIVTDCIRLIGEHLYKAAVDHSFICTDERINGASGEEALYSPEGAMAEAPYTEGRARRGPCGADRPEDGYTVSADTIRHELAGIKPSAACIGWHLRRIQKNGWYSARGYKDIYMLAKEEFGISQSSTTRYMNLCRQFSKGKNSPELDEKYKDFSTAQLIEMLNMDPEGREAVTPEMTVKDIREMKKQAGMQEQFTCRSEAGWHEWLDGIPASKEWYTDNRIQAVYHKRDLPDGSRIIAVTYGHKSGKEKGSTYFHMVFSDSYRKNHADGKHYPDCYTNETIEKEQIVEILMEMQETYEEEEPDGYISNDFVMKCLRIKPSGTAGDKETAAMAKKYQKFYDGHEYVPKYFRSKDGTELRDYAGTLSTCSGSLEANGSIIIFDAVREIMLVDRNLRRGELPWEEAERCLGRILCVSAPEELKRICRIFAERSA